MAELDEVDIGYRFLPEVWGRGLATEVCRFFLDYGRTTLKLKRIVGIVDINNHASIKVLTKIGMHYEKKGSLGFTAQELSLYA